MHHLFMEKDEQETEAYQDGAGDLINDNKSFEGELVPQLSGHHDLEDVGAHIDQQADGEDDDPFLQCVICGENGCITQPEQDDAWIECIDEEA